MKYKDYLSHDLLELMTALGDLVQLENWERFNGGLDVTGKNITGAFSLFSTLDNYFEIMFHVAPLIPSDFGDDEQLIGKKRHVGNDIVVLVFSESNVPFDPSGFKSHFNRKFYIKVIYIIEILIILLDYFIVVKKLPVEKGGGPTSYRYVKNIVILD